MRSGRSLPAEGGGEDDRPGAKAAYGDPTGSTHCQFLNKNHQVGEFRSELGRIRGRYEEVQVDASPSITLHFSPVSNWYKKCLIVY